MSQAFITYIKENYSEEEIPLEIGAGYESTKYFSEHFKKMYSVEDKSKFCNLYHSNYIQVDLDANGWYNSEDLKQALPTDYTFIVLDGPLGGFDPPFKKQEGKIFRSGFVKVSWDYIKKDVDIIVDDIIRNGYDWYELEVVAFLKNENYSCVDKGTFCVCSPLTK
tara:strand:- start:719 stop:1213 length:495 start_codon:yes stop_codon:yes gene_type:complete